MARDVETNLTANDKTGSGLASAERRFSQSSKKIEAEGNKLNSKFGQSVVDMAEKISPKAAAALTRGFASAGEAAGPLLAGGIAAAAPVLAATVSAAIIAGAGVGAAGIGVVLVAQDARVQAAGKKLGESLLSGLQQDASPFIRPVLDGIATIEARFAESRKTIQSIFANSSNFVAPLVDGATRGLQGILRGVDALVANGQPVIDALGRGLAKVGDATGDMFERIASNSDEAAAALDFVFNTISKIIDVAGILISVLTKVFGWLEKFHIIEATMNSLIAGPFGAFLTDTEKKTDATATAAGGLAEQFQKSAEATKLQQQAAANLGPTMQQIKADIDAVTAANRALYGSDTDVAGALADVNEKLKENGRTHSLATEKGRENRTALEGLAATLQTNYENFVKVNGESAASIAKGESLRSSFIRTAEKAGYSAKAAQELANKILGIPSKKETDLHANTHDAEGRIRALQAQINSLHGKTVTVTVRRMTVAGEHVSGPGGSGTQLKGFDASSTWAARDSNSTSRTGGPMSVNSRIENRLYLDGTPFRAYVDEVVAESNRAAAYGARVGAR